MAMYTSNHCTGAYITVKKLFIIFLILILILISFLFMWNGKKISISLLKSERDLHYVPAQSDYDSSSFIIVTNPIKSWFLLNGTRYPKPAKISQKTGIRDAKLLPNEDPGNDRILNQLMFVPPNYDSIVKSQKVKTTLVNNGYPYWFKLKGGKQRQIGLRPRWWPPNKIENIFKEYKCPVDACRLTDDKNERQTADLVFFIDTYEHTKKKRPANQLYAFYNMECPLKTKPFAYPDIFNWTITYRHDSTIAVPYDKWVYYDPRIKQMEQNKNFAANKTKKVAWFVSNCHPQNHRMEYAQQLRKYIEVDIYGSCGTKKCPRSETKKCNEILDEDYKFYLAFENSNCKDYITEKFFRNALGHNVIPIAMGAPPEDYEKYAPFRSYIHVEHFESPKELAKYLHILDRNDELYNSYFKWKGTGEFLFTKFWCQICAMLHDDYARSIIHWYEDINDWWRGSGTCTSGYWRDLYTNNSIITNAD